MAINVARRKFIAILGSAAAVPLSARAQQTGKLPTIGFLGNGPSIHTTWTAAFVERMRELGWIEDRTVAIEYRWSLGRRERMLKSQPNSCARRSMSLLRMEAPSEY
jgi:putative tryptophan/tyrosine transport system substrate-binding protein